jgi:hypothetical protein
MRTTLYDDTSEQDFNTQLCSWANIGPYALSASPSNLLLVQSNSGTTFDVEVCVTDGPPLIASVPQRIDFVPKSMYFHGSNSEKINEV